MDSKSLELFQKLFPKEEKSWASLQREANENPTEEHAAKLADSKQFFEKIMKDLEFMMEMREQQKAAEKTTVTKEQVKAASEAVKAAMKKAHDEELREEEVHKASELARNELKLAKEKEEALKIAAASKAGVTLAMSDKKLQAAKDKYLRTMGDRYIKNGKLQHINTMCLNHCLDNQTAKCWAHDDLPVEKRCCPFIHRDDPRWDGTKCVAILALEAQRKAAKASSKRYRGGSKRRNKTQRSRR
jgi:hypothetical protein